MTATKKKVLKTSVIAAIIILIAAAIAIAVYLHQDEKFEKEQNDALLILEERKGDYDEYTIVLSDTSRSEAERFAEKIGATLRITDDGSFATLTLTDGRTIRDVYADDANRKYLSSFSADYKAKVSDILTDEEHRYPTPPTVGNTDELSAALSYLNLGSVWNKTKGSGITVAVIDTGIDTDHPEFAGRISEYSYNATEDKIVKDWLLEDGSYDWSLVEDEQGHGTGVAAALGAASDNAGMVGVAPSVTIIVIKAECNANGEFTRTSDLVFGLYYAIERDVSVVNMSFGTQSLDNPFEAATQLAYDSDVICVASAGNESTASLTYPAADPLVIGVGALASDSWELASYSNYGENVDVVAPGSVYTAKMGGGYKTTTGTSLASPLVAGAVALLCATDKYITYDEVTELLYASSYDLGQLGRDFDYGFGALDAMALIIEERGTLTLDMMTDELEDEEALFIRNHTLQEMLEPERYFAVFDGWYYDPYYTEPYNYYEDKFVSDITLYAKWSGEDDGIPFTYVELSDGTIEIRSYTGRRRYISVPEYIDGKLVTSIGDFAFSGETGLREINLPRGLTKIGRYAFENCMNLVSMEIPEGVTSLGEGAFYNAVRMSGIAFVGSPKLTVIGSEAFAYCSSLRKIEIPEKVTSVYGSAFLGATSLGAINVSKANEKFVSEGGALFNRTKSILIAYPAGLVGNYSVPGGTREIGAYAFAFTRAKDVNLNKAEKVGDSAFLNSYLNGVIIPSSVTVLGVKAFANSYYLSSVTLGSGLSEIPAEAFYCCAALSEIIVPKGITSIGGGAFADSGLASVEFAEGSRLNSIGQSAFSGCMLTELSLPKSLITIGSYAFANNFFLSDVDFGENSNLRTVGAYAFANGSLTEISLPEGLETLGDFAFMNQSITGEVYIPARLTYFGAGAFASNAYLTAFAVDGENSTYNSISGVIYTEDGKELIAYPTGNTATAYSVLTNTETIGAAAFWGANNLTSLTLNAGLISLEEYSLAYMTSLRSIAIPDSVISIARRTFLANMNMSSISFGADAKIARLGFESLAYTGITSITIPKNVSTIAQYALAGDTKLTSVTFAENSKLESISAYMFDGADNLQSITFKSGSALTSIQAHGLEGMRKLTKIDFGDAKITNIDNFAFHFCEKLTSFTIPETVESIGRYAFYACYGLTSVTIPESVEHIGSFAFLANENLELYFKSNTLPIYLDEDWDHGIKGYYLGVLNVTEDGDFKYATLTDGNIAILKYTGEATELDLNTLGYGNITVIGGDAFAYSTLENVTLPETLVTIQKEAFYHSALKNIVIPASVEFIGNSAFADNPIESLTFADNSSLKVIEQSAFERTESLSGAVEIPASVTTLGRAVFRNSSVSSVAFEEGTAITEIPEEAFANSGITAFTAPDSVTKIGDGAFRGAKSLKSFAYGTGELWLGANAFYQSGLESLHISENIVMVEEFALTSLESLESFTVSESNPYYKAVDGLLLSKDGKKLISVPAGRTGALTVPETVEIIGFGAFETTALDSVSFSPDSNILSLGYRAFFGAKNIREITIPASVVSIDYYAFAYAKKLEKVTFAEGSRLTGIYEGAFYGCQSLSDITLPDGITEISDFAFYGCSALKNIPVSETSEIKGIYSYAFAYTGITGELILPDTLIDIDNYAFLGTKAEKITIPATNAKDLVIGIGAFEEARNLTEITLPFIGASYEDMDISWFGYVFGAGAYEANSTYVPEGLKKVNINGDITFIGMHAFDGVVTLEEIVLPETFTSIYPFAFYNTTAKYECKSALSVWSFDMSGGLIKDLSSFHIGKGIAGDLILEEGITSIGWREFEDCTSLASIKIPEGVTSIDAWAFSGCSSLVSVEIPDSVTLIATEAFSNCTSLTSIVLPEGITSISGAFSGCTSLTNIVLPEGITSISGAFSGCTSLANIVLPEGITSISGAFSGCTSLKSIEIPNSVTSIGSYAFRGCSSLTSIVIPENVTSIDSCAFEYCTSLVSLEIPDSVTLIGDHAFSCCSSLANIVLPKAITEIGDLAFYACTSLYMVENKSDLPITFSSAPGYVTNYAKLIIDNEGNRIYRDADSGFEYIDTPNGFRFIKENGAYKLIAYLGSEETVTLPKDINGNSYEIYQLRGVKNVIIPEGVTSIDSYAFYDCSSLTSIEIPDSVTSIDSYAFYDCSSLTSIVIPESVIEIGSHVFGYCTSLTSIVIPEGVTSIGEGAFSSCRSLASIVLPKGVTSIGWSAFSDCTSLMSIEIPDSVTSIDSYAFSGCSSLESIEIPNSVTSIGSSAFSDCNINDFSIDTENTSFTIIDGVVYNKAVTKIVYVLDSVTEVVIPCTVTDISSAFNGNVNINRVYFEENSTLTSIGSYAFYGCSSLTSIEIPEGVTSINHYAFYNCSSLKSIVLSEGIRYIDQAAFCNCSSLESIEIPDSVTSIGSYAFASCTTLMSIVIPEGVTSIGVKAFSSCRSLYMVENKSDLPITLDNYVDYGYITQYAKLLIDKEGNKIYKDPDNDIEYIVDDFLFKKENGVYKLIAYLGSKKTVTLPKDINGNSYEIYQLRGVKNAIIPEGVTSISSSAFSGCSSLESIEIPNSVTSIGSSAFWGCSSLERIEIPDSVTSIGSSAFRGCSSLKSIVIPEGVTSIGNDAFSGTAYYNNASNWIDGALYIGNCLIRVDTFVKNFEVKEETGAIASGAFSGCYSLKHLIIGREHYGVLYQLTNLETLVITEMPTSHYIYGYFGSSNIPITLKNIVLKSGVRMRNGAFSGLSGITIYAEDTKRDTQWDKNFPGWNNGNTVIYGDKWITTEFYDNDGNLYASEIFSTSQVIRVPYLEIPSNAQYSYVVEGFDMDDDGIVDTIPATSATDISAVAVVRRVVNSYTVTFVDKDGVTPLYTITLPYGSEIIVPENLEKQGYSFLGWQGYEVGMTVTGDAVITSEWQHEGEGHEYAAPVWVDATCTEGGYNKHICTLCGEWYATNNTEPLGHGYEKSVVATTCTERGYDRYLCSCGDEYRENYTEALGHSFTEWVVDTPATCETEGLRHHICYACGTGEDEVIFAVGHSYSSYVVTVPTCTKEGEILYRCACGDEIIETVEKVGHSYEQKYTSKSFLQILIELLFDIFFGYEGDSGYYFQCTDCGHIATEDEAISTYSSSASVKEECEHQLGDFVVVHEANCTESEVEGRICSLCEEVIEARISGNPLGHSFGAWVETLAPTCEKVGTERRDCTECDHYETRDIAATGHTSSEWIVDAEPTCTAKGSKHKECTVCDKVIENSKISMIPHTYTSAVTPPTCTDQGYTTHTCTCGDSYIDSYVEANGHSFGAWVETLAPTCDKVGAERRDCTECDHYETRDIAATGHTSSEWIVDAEPTCTAEGSKHKECTVCDKVIESSKISMIPHTYTSSVTPPTCTAQGYTTHTCTCGDSYIDSYTNALGHSFGAWVETLAPTCDKVGGERRDCSVCSYYETRQIAALGYLQKFVDAVSVLSKDEQSAKATYNELYTALQLYAKLTDEEKQQANASFLLLQTAIEDYNAKAETASDEMNKATELAFAPLSASFTFLAALLFLLKKKFWMK